MKYDDSNRGKIQNRDRARQLIDFGGLRYNNITPTDIDGFLEKGDRLFVFYEYKLPSAEMPHGQKVALMRLVDGLTKAGKLAVLFLCRHNEYNPLSDVKASKAIVEAIYWNESWHKGHNLTVREQTDRFLRWADSLGG